MGLMSIAKSVTVLKFMGVVYVGLITLKCCEPERKQMLKIKFRKYYIDEEILLVKVNGGKRLTGAGGVVSKAQSGYTCRTCFCLIAENHLASHLQFHTTKPVQASK